MAAAAADTGDSSDEQYCDDWDNHEVDLENEDMEDVTSDDEDEDITLARLRDRLRDDHVGDNVSSDCDSESSEPDPQCSTPVSSAWQDVIKTPSLPPYTPSNVPGARVSLDNGKGPVDFFQLFFSDSAIDRLIDETHHNATSKKDKAPQKHKVIIIIIIIIIIILIIIIIIIIII